MHLPVLALLALSARGAHAVYSVLSESYTPDTFFSKFDFFTGADPTHGHVAYQSHRDAYLAGLASHDSSSIFIGADATALAPNGRKAVRLESKKRYTHGLFLLDATHVPAGCGTWPAFWTFGPNWPSSGEIDIMEGVNNMPENNIALHTSPGCVVTGAGGTGAVRTKNCDVNAAGQPANEGCSTRDLRPSAFGAGFNANRGGLYAMEWNSEAIKVWFFPRGSAPADAMGARPAPENWGPPVAVFQGACNIDERFREHRIVINTSFCGDWAGSVWGQSAECAAKAASCVDWVANHPKAFKGAYWRILGLRVFSS